MTHKGMSPPLYGSNALILTYFSSKQVPFFMSLLFLSHLLLLPHSHSRSRVASRLVCYFSLSFELDLDFPPHALSFLGSSWISISLFSLSLSSLI
jgi:hypothetical protein